MRALAAVLLASLACAGPASAQTRAELLPLAPGTRWSFVHAGAPSLVLESVSPADVGGHQVAQLRVRGGRVFYAGDAAYFDLGGPGRSIVATGYAGQVREQPTPWRVLPGRLRAGQSWEVRNHYVDSQMTFAFRVTVVGRERVRTPSGRYRAWRLEYVLTEHLGTERDFRVWYAPGVGIVQYEEFQRSSRGVKTPLRPTRVHRLARVERGRPLSPDPPVDRARRDRAITLTGRVTNPNATVGDPLPVRFALQNRSSETIAALPSLDGSYAAARRPHVSLEVRDAQGALQTVDVVGCGYTNALRARDFRILVPGEEMDPVGPDTFSHPMMEWRPSAPGAYTATLRYDSRFGSELPPPGPLRDLVEASPQGVFEATVRFTVR